jgi:hypothetical protein
MASTTIAARGAEFGSAAIVHPASGIILDRPTTPAIPGTAATGTIIHPTTAHRTPLSGRFIVRPRIILEAQAIAHPPIAHPVIVRRPTPPDIARQPITPAIVRRPINPEMETGPGLNLEMEIDRALRTIDQTQGRLRTDLNPDKPDRPLLQNLHHRLGLRRKTGPKHNRPDRPRRISQLHHRPGPHHKTSQRTPGEIAEVRDKAVKGRDNPGEGATRIRANTS